MEVKIFISNIVNRESLQKGPSAFIHLVQKGHNDTDTVVVVEVVHKLLPHYGPCIMPFVIKMNVVACTVADTFLEGSSSFLFQVKTEFYAMYL